MYLIAVCRRTLRSANVGAVHVRAVRIPPAIMLSVTAQDLNIVLQRIEPGRMDQLDLVIATNFLIYYDVFEQALALANVAKMLHPGGIFLTNHLVLSSPSMMMGATRTCRTPTLATAIGSGGIRSNKEKVRATTVTVRL